MNNRIWTVKCQRCKKRFPSCLRWHGLVLCQTCVIKIREELEARPGDMYLGLVEKR